jgi:transmembrane sensor
MENNDYISLIHKSLTGQITAQENTWLQQWLAQSSEHENEYRQIKALWEEPIEEEFISEADEIAGLRILEDNVAMLIAKERDTQRLKTLFWMMFGICLIVLASFCYMYFRNAAAFRHGPYSIATTGPGTILLSDSSVVHIKSSSILTHHYTGDKREVGLQGEALFTVTADSRPFVLRVASSIIRVRGTTFHVRALQNRPLEVAVMQGAVEVNLGEKAWVVNQGQYLSLKDGIQSAIADLHTFREEASIPARLEFKRAPLQDVIKQIEEKYSITCFVPMELRQCTFTGTLERASLAEVIRILSYSMRIEFKQTSIDRYYISGKSCSS